MQVVDDLFKQNGHAYLVGGVVRDLLLNIPTKDIDIEVHHVSLDQLASTLKKFGFVNYIGKAFGILKLNNTHIDWALPRRESGGRKPDVTVVPDLSLKEAFARRDLTINAMGIDLKTLELIDPFDGIHDIERKILRATDSKKFQEDPLRFYRVMQFTSRFSMEPDEELNTLCRQMDISTVSVERIEMEFEKMCLKSTMPSRGIRWIKNIGRLYQILPELAKTVGVMQNPEFHPEGDVFEHSMQAFDAATDYSYENDEQKLTIQLAALCHDLGKPYTTQIRKGRITSYGHDTVGKAYACSMLKRITTKKYLISIIARLVRYHMAPSLLVRQHAKLEAFKRLAKKLAPITTMRELGLLSLADRRGRNGKSHIPLPPKDEQVAEFFKIVESADILDTPEKPLILGRDLLEFIPAGPKLGKAVDYAYELQIDKDIRDKDELLDKVIKKFAK